MVVFHLSLEQCFSTMGSHPGMGVPNKHDQKLNLEEKMSLGLPKICDVEIRSQAIKCWGPPL